MTNDQIIEIAKQAGARKSYRLDDCLVFTPEDVLKFAELIQARAVPDGYVVVPETAHDEQWQAAFDIYDQQFHQDQMQSQIMCIKEMYRAMIAAAQKGSDK